MLTDLAWDQFYLKERAGYASLSNAAQNASLPVSQNFLAEPLLQRFFGLPADADGFSVVFFQEDGARPPGGGQSSWPNPGELSVCLRWFYSAPFWVTAGCDPDRCGTAKADSIEKPKAF